MVKGITARRAGTGLQCFLSALLLWACVAVAPAADEPLLRPEEPPVAVARLGRAEDFARLSATRQGRLLTGKAGWSVTLPGTAIRIASVEDFLSRLAQRGASSLWFCLAQEGSSLASLTSALGWSEAPGGARDGDFPSSLGITAREEDVLVQVHRDGRVMLSRDEKSVRRFLEQTGRAGAWRDELSRFLRRDHAGIWLNPRPLLGLAAMYTGVDIRSMLLRYGLGVPESLQIDLFPTGGDAGFSFRAQGLIAEDWPPPSSPTRIIHFRDQAPLQVSIRPPDALWARLEEEPGMAALLLALNLDATSLLPASVSVAGWRREDGAAAWSAVCLVENGEAFVKSMPRVWSLLRGLAGGRPGSPSIKEKDTSGEPAMLLEWNGLRLAVTTALSGGDHFLLLADREEHLPDPETIRVADADSRAWLEWRLRPDPAMRTAILRAAQASLRTHLASAPDSRLLEALLPDEETGSLIIQEGTLRVESRNGMLPVLLPYLLGMLEDVAGRF